MRPLIGLSGRRWGVERLVDVPAALDGISFDLHYAEYPACVAAAGGVPVELTRDAPVADLLAHLDALVITGGADVDPSLYGAPEEPGLGVVERERDVWELSLVTAAFAQRTPILGICRGAQLLNVYFGGTLQQDLPGDVGARHARWDPHRAERAHAVVTVPGSVASRLYGARVSVNSLHHQAIDRLGDGLVVTGRGDDGVVEVIEHCERPEILAVQWHPEALSDALDPVFGWLVDHADHYALARHG